MPASIVLVPRHFAYSARTVALFNPRKGSDRFSKFVPTLSLTVERFTMQYLRSVRPLLEDDQYARIVKGRT